MEEEARLRKEVERLKKELKERIKLDRDINAKLVLAQKKLKESEDRFRKQSEFLNDVIESIPSPLYVVDAYDYTVKMANQAASPAGKWANLTCHALTRMRDEPCEDEEHVCPLDEVKRTKKPAVVEHIHYGEDGSLRNIEVHGYPILDEKGNVTQMIEFFLDITERKRAEEEIENRMEDLKIINTIIRDVSSTIDLDEVLHRITKSAAELINGDAASIAILDEEKGVVTYPYHYNMPEKLKKIVARKGQGLAGQIIETKKSVIIEEYPSHPRALKEFVDAGLRVLIAVPLISKGKAFGALGVFGLAKEKRFSERDLELLEAVGKEAAVAIENARLYQEIKGFSETLEEKVKERTAELEEAQKALVILLEDVNQAKEELEEANIKLQELDQLKSMFIASMSHELRTPLNSIIGFTGIILQGMAGEINEEQRKQLTMVRHSANHLLALINDIIDLSKIEAGKVELTIGEFDLSNLVQEVRDSFRVSAAEEGLKMSLKMPKRLVIKGDERRTKQVLVNLVGNAVKFTDKGEIEIKVAKKEGMAEVSVRDTGIGIRKENMDRLFKAFSQIPAEGRPKQEGTGLGLYLSKKIAGLLGGDIWAESEFGKGSMFTLTLPLKYREVKT